MNNTPGEDATKTVLELDLASYSDIARALEENLDVHAVKAFEDQVQSFVDLGLAEVGLAREDVVLGSAGDNAILVFDDPALMHGFADAVQNAVAAHNSRRSVASAKRRFRMGAATGTVILLQAERRIVGTTVIRAVRLEAAATTGQLLVDAATYELLPADLKGFYGPEEVIGGKRDEQFSARRCTFAAAGEHATAAQPARPTWLWAAVAVACLIGGTVAVQVVCNWGEKQDGNGVEGNSKQASAPNQTSASGRPYPPVGHDRDRDAARWAVGIGAEVKLVVQGEERPVLNEAELPDEPFRLTHVDFRKARRIADADLERLSGTGVFDINLEGTAITDAGLPAIADLKLLVLCLKSVGGITDIGAERIGRIGSLQWLDLKHTMVSDEGLTHLTKLAQMEELDVKGTQVTRAGIGELREALQRRNQRCIIHDDWSGRD